MPILENGLSYASSWTEIALFIVFFLTLLITIYSVFFVKPRLHVVLGLENGQLKGPSPVALHRKSGTRVEACNICFVRIGVLNRGRTTADDCKVYADLVRGTVALGRFVYYLKWEMDKKFTECDLDRSDLHKSTSDFFPSKTDLELGPGRILNVVYATDQDNKAYFVSERERALDIPSTTDVWLAAVGPKFAAQFMGRFRISITSWKDIRIFRVTPMTRFMDAVRALVAHVKKT